MFHRSFSRNGCAVLLWLGVIFGVAVAGHAQAPLTVNGIVDQGDYSDTATFSVPSTAGYSYSVKLDGNPIPTDLNVVVSAQDYHQLLIWRTNLTTLAVTNRLVAFIVEQAFYNHTERGYPVWTPYPVINATAAELAGAQLRVLTPHDFPLGLEIPVVAWIEKADGSAVRANALLSAPGHPSIQLFRGVGSGFLAATNPAGALDYAPSVPGLQTNKAINLESNTTWTTVTGILSGAITWAANSRISVGGHLTIPAGSTLTIGEGTIVRLSSGVNITNNGQVTINGTEEQPVVFTPFNRAQPWGGFLMYSNSAALDANAAIFVASGAQQSGFPGHKPQQPLFMIDRRPHLNLTNCAAIYMAGQFGHGTAGTTNSSDPNWTVINIVHTLIQHCVTGGEWNGCRMKLLNSAVIEMPFVTPVFADADEDGIYFTSGEFEVRDSLIGWTRDDGIDSGSNDGGSVTVSNNWHDSIFHEAFAWSGGGGTPGTRRTTNTHCVAINCGQGYECGWSRGPTSPLSPYDFVTDCLAVANGVGARFGDNYTPAEGFTYYGFLLTTNSILINNIRDVYGYNWQDWAYRASSMDIRGNWLTAPNTNHPQNQIWNPATDGWRLAAFMSTPPDASVGIGFAVWTNLFQMTNIFDGVPVGLSCFTTNFVSVDYTFQDSGGALSSGTLTFAPGETVKRIYPAGFNAADKTQLQVVLSNPARGELTGLTNVTFTGSAPTPRISCAIAGKQKDVGRIGEGLPISLSSPSSEPVTVDYKLEFGGLLLASGTLTFQPGQTLQWLAVPGVNPANYDLLRLALSNPNWATLSSSNCFLVRTPPLPFTPAPLTLLAKGSVWKYLDTGTNLGAPWAPTNLTGWTGTNFIDSAWLSGPAPLGYSNSPAEATKVNSGPGNNKYITTYFRTYFKVTNAESLASLNFNFRRDDGGAVYLNGAEVVRDNLPTAASYTTAATTNNGGTVTVYDPWLVSTNALTQPLHNGTNVLAVEVHQSGPTSSDIIMDLEVIGNAAPPAGSSPYIYWNQFDGTNLVMAWSDPTYLIERSTNLAGPYTNPVPASPITVPPTNSAAYFRLRK